MTKRDSLRSLIKKFPPPPELKASMNAASQLHDRSAAIVATAILESVLQQLIVAKLQNKSPDLIGSLFKHRGPLSDFHSKILVASAFGIISPNQESELMRIKSIRNVFAHAASDVTFDTPAIAKEVEGFLMLQAMNKVVSDLPEISEKMSRKTTYLLMVEILCIMISFDHLNNHGSHLFE